VAVAIGFVVLCRHVIEASRALAEEKGPLRAPSTSLEEEAWIAAAAGLDRYHGALKARIVVLVGGAALLALAGATRSIDLMKALMLLLPLVSLVIGVVLALGLYAYARAPAPGAGEAAMAALVLMALAMFLDLYAFTLILELFGNRF